MVVPLELADRERRLGFSTHPPGVPMKIPPILWATLAVASSVSLDLTAQQAFHPTLRLAVQHDSGYLANSGAAPAVVWTQEVYGADGDWLQVRFRDTNLPAGSKLRIHAPAKPEWVQWHDANSLRDYQGHSCQFLGPVLRVELVAAPGTAGNRALIDQVVRLQVGAVAEVDSICGTTDDRALSNDVRACRINSSCTAWLFSPYAVGTAGHCMSSTSGQILHFNVPLSTSTGSTVPAAPMDQYAMEPFHQFLNGGVGADWSVSAAVRNSNTGLFPGERQGSWFTIDNPPSAVSGVSIRITGYGTGNGNTGSASANQAQKTHVGLRVSTSNATALSYNADTTGGNSGSPVIHEQTGNVIGVHTHGGCSSVGGANSGTQSSRADWAAARAAVLALHVVGEKVPFGTGCGSPSGVPSLAGIGIPEKGRTLSIRASGLNASGSYFGALIIGFDNTTWSQGSLPASLASFGLAGCQLYVRPDISDTLFSVNGEAARNISVPNTTAVVGSVTYFQYFAYDPAAKNVMSMVSTSALRVLIGS